MGNMISISVLQGTLNVMQCCHRPT